MTRTTRGAAMQAAPRPCFHCGKQRPVGRLKYCSDDCAAQAGARVRRRNDEHKRLMCRRCGGEKPKGRGILYCDPCALILADASAQFAHEQWRRRRIAETADCLAQGERLARRTIDVPDGFKWCPRCQNIRPLASFPTRSEARRTHAAYCKPCQRSYNRERSIKLNFGLTWDEYELLMACQDFRCAICRGKPRKYALSVDHDHKTGEIRGLLCSRCNHKLLGSANDDPARLRRAADYLEANEAREVFGGPKYAPGTGPAS